MPGLYGYQCPYTYHQWHTWRLQCSSECGRMHQVACERIYRDQAGQLPPHVMLWGVVRGKGLSAYLRGVSVRRRGNSVPGTFINRLVYQWLMCQQKAKCLLHGLTHAKGTCYFHWTEVVWRTCKVCVSNILHGESRGIKLSKLPALSCQPIAENNSVHRGQSRGQDVGKVA